MEPLESDQGIVSERVFSTGVADESCEYQVVVGVHPSEIADSNNGNTEQAHSNRCHCSVNLQSRQRTGTATG